MKHTSQSLPKLLGIKPGYTTCLINPPEGYMERLAAEATQVRLVRGIEENADVIQAFVHQSDDLSSSFPHLKRLLGTPHALWVAWPRPLSGIKTDLTTTIVRSIGTEHGLLDVKTCPLDDDWSGMKFVYSLKDRRA